MAIFSAQELINFHVQMPIEKKKNLSNAFLVLSRMRCKTLVSLCLLDNIALLPFPSVNGE